MNMLWVAPVMPDYDSARATFSWRRERSRLAGLPGGGVNIGYEAVDRHLRDGHGDRPALRCIARDGSLRTVSYARLAEDSSRVAHVLETLGVGRGERVFTLLGRRYELYATVLGTLRAGRVVCPLFTAFGPEPVALRMELGNARAVVTTRELYERKVAPVRSRLPHLRHVLLIDPGDDPPSDTLSFPALTAAASDTYTVGQTDPADLALLHFTSGTTGTPKGAMHVHEAVLAHHVTAAYALDLHEGDVFWCTADPGWVTGMSYGIIAPLTHGVTTVVDEGDFAPGRWYDILADQHVTVWYTAPTALRMLMRAAPRDGSLPAERHDLSSLRFVASVGEPLNPEAVHWGREALGLPVHDTWWQTETGAIMIANFAADPVRPGSMGRPMPGVEAAVLACGEDGRVAVVGGHVRVVGEPDVQGELALRAGWPSMFRGYLHEPQRYESCFADGWYLTGDLVSRDADGWFWFVGRADDVIKSAGHLIGPFEVESALMEHPAVAEAGVIGRPDPLAGAIVKAFVLLRPEYPPSAELRRDLIAFARRRLGPAVAPREVGFVDTLPHTRSGKVMRRLLRARELGLPEGDVSTLEAPEPAGTAGAPGPSGKEQ
ncbi:acetate--CoA ligase [Streptomyces roseicoloratus]|uniref:acetate--CoA ligase n=1 Tax=Streptomyces roseicoloratus TaxID=2508722 RepID=A0ABY9S3C5_9ACTN|nr:acetate--CoA ligase [Streptomyces roseicoloratus]WMX48433.1 acetate--CoA ligase [Streptomyces roseicoloratus]